VRANARALEATQREIDDVGAGIAALRAQVAQEHADLDRRAAEAYMSGPIPSLGVALGTTSIADFQTVMEYLDASARSDRELVDRLTTRNTELWRQEARLASLRGHLQATRDGLDQEARSMSDRLNQQLAVMAGLQRDRAAAQALVADLTDERDRLAAQAAIDRAGGNPGPPPKPDPLPPDPGPAAVRQLVIDDLTSLDPVGGQPQVRQPLEQHLQADLALGPGQRPSQAEVGPGGERHVPVVLSSQIQPVGLGELLGVAVRRAERHDDLVALSEQR